MIIRGQFADHFFETELPAIDATLKMSLAENRRASVFPKIFQVKTSNRSIEQTTGITGVGQFREIPEGGAVESDQPVRIPSKTFTHKRFGLSIVASRDMIEDDKHEIIQDSVRGLAESEVDTREMQAASVLNDGFSVNGYDGVPLFSASHPLQYAGGTQSNLMTVAMALSHTALEEATIQMFLMVDETGKPIKFTPDMLVIPPQLMYKAKEILGSSMRSDTANNTTNALTAIEGGMPQQVVWRYLTSATRWFLISKKNRLIWYDRRKPYRAAWVKDETESGYTARRYRCSYGHSHYFGTFASNAS
jgi:phage major head subunit gpT-like protein